MTMNDDGSFKVLCSGSGDGGHEGAVPPQDGEVREAGPHAHHLVHQAQVVPHQAPPAQGAGRAEEPAGETLHVEIVTLQIYFR